MSGFQSRETTIEALNTIAYLASTMARELNKKTLYHGDLKAGVDRIQTALDVVKKPL